MVEGIDNWVYASEIPELIILINHHKQQITKKNSDNRIFNKRHLFWLSFHIIALLFSYSELRLFNQSGCFESGSFKTKEFWPLTDIFRFEDKSTESDGWCGYTEDRYLGYYIEFNGFFYNYDYTEFLFYTIILILYLAYLKISNK
jgi:hypothetical protein